MDNHLVRITNTGSIVYACPFSPVMDTSNLGRMICPNSRLHYTPWDKVDIAWKQILKYTAYDIANIGPNRMCLAYAFHSGKVQLKPSSGPASPWFIEPGTDFLRGYRLRIYVFIFSYSRSMYDFKRSPQYNLYMDSNTTDPNWISFTVLDEQWRNLDRTGDVSALTFALTGCQLSHQRAGLLLRSWTMTCVVRRITASFYVCLILMLGSMHGTLDMELWSLHKELCSICKWYSVFLRVYPSPLSVYRGLTDLCSKAISGVFLKSYSMNSKGHYW